MDEVAEAGRGNITNPSQDNPDADQQERPGNRPLVGKPLTKLAPLPGFWTIGRDEHLNLSKAMKAPLSGYLGGSSRAGYWCERLSDEWSGTFGCQYAIPCNSATSGLLAACMAAGVGQGDVVWVSDYTMSASATCAIMLGAEVELVDIEEVYFSMAWRNKPLNMNGPKAIIVTNLFGCPAHDLQGLRKVCDELGIILIEDNAQAPFATCGGQYTGTIGHIGVYSLNVHKHLQCGEGGVVVTDDPSLAHRIDCAINHGELMRVNPHLGLNLRMTEPIAAIACAQLKRGSQIVQSRVNLAHHITDYFEGIPFVEPPAIPPGSNHVFYMWAGKIKSESPFKTRYQFLSRLRARGVPFREGYSKPLHLIFPSYVDRLYYPVASEMEAHRLFCFEICAYDPNVRHLKQMKQIIQYEADKIKF